MCFYPFIKAQLRNVTRLDIVWDVYLEDSLKSTARENRGRGVRRRVAPSNTIPGNWQEFLRLADNKTELFDFLAHQVVENLSGEKEVYTTCCQNVLCSRVHEDISSLAPCAHEEADTRMLLRAVDSANKGYRRIMLRTVNTDVLVLAVSAVVCLEDTEIWVVFGTGKHLRYIIFRRTKSPKNVVKRHVHFPCSMPLRVVTRCRRLLAGEKRLHFTYGSLSMRSHLYFLPC